MSERFFVETPIAGDRAELVGPEAQHLIKVMRGQVGDEITLFDGSGFEFNGRVAGIRRNAVTVHELDRRDIDRELPFRVVFAVALPKGDRQRWLTEKLTELGVTQLVPILTARSIVQPDAATVARLQRSVIEASKQCGRNRLMGIERPQPWDSLVGSIASHIPRLIAHPSEGEWAEELPTRNRFTDGGVVAAIGPEGGFTEAEIRLAHDTGWRCVTLGPRILRVDTAAVALAAALTLP